MIEENYKQRTVQYVSKRLGEEFLDVESWSRFHTRHHTKCTCGKPATIIAISFQAGFCTPGCYIKFDREFMEWCEKNEHQKSN
jgi:hypothetical protein